MSIEFISEKDYLPGLVLILEKELKETQGNEEIDKFSKSSTHLLCVKSDRHIKINPSALEYTRKDGSKSNGNHLTIVYNIEGSPLRLNIQEELLKISKSLNIHLKQYISYLAKSIILYQEKFPDHSIIEGFKIIESDVNFADYKIYFALRNILAHSPYYRDKTMNYFNASFNKNDFDYLKYEPNNKLIVLDLDSDKTIQKLNR